MKWSTKLTRKLRYWSISQIFCHYFSIGLAYEHADVIFPEVFSNGNFFGKFPEIFILHKFLSIFPIFPLWSWTFPELYGNFFGRKMENFPDKSLHINWSSTNKDKEIVKQQNFWILYSMFHYCIQQVINVWAVISPNFVIFPRNLLLFCCKFLRTKIDRKIIYRLSGVMYNDWAPNM